MLLQQQCVPDKTLQSQFTLAVSEPELYNLSDFLKGPGIQYINNNKSMPVAVCNWYINSGTNHFPHEMQHLYRCFSYFNSFTTETKWILLRDMKQSKKWYWNDIFRLPIAIKSRQDMNAFIMNGFLLALQNAYTNLYIIDTNTIDKNELKYYNKYEVRKGDSTIFGGYAYRIRTYNDVYDLRTAIIERGKLNISITNNDNDNNRCNSNSLLPKIAILNRLPDSYRSILNANVIALKLQQILNTTNIPIEYFENVNFVKQVEFFTNYDIIISPHGAQLTGIPFMPSTNCSAILEIFPNQYYYQPFFGSLAASSNIKQYTMYIGNGNPVQVWQSMLKSNRGHERRNSRQVNLCINVNDIIQYIINTIIPNWQQCCQQQQQQVQS